MNTAGAEQAIRLAEYARNDSSLIQNHILNGVPDRLREEIFELDGLLEAVAGNEEYSELFTSDMRRLKDALSVYAEFE